MSVFHIVAFQVSDQSNLPALSKAMLALKDECTRDGKQYILQAFGGKQSSPEGHCGGRQVVFVMEFANQDDANYYINEDPKHNEFKAKLPGWGLNGVTVLDFTPGAF